MAPMTLLVFTSLCTPFPHYTTSVSPAEYSISDGVLLLKQNQGFHFGHSFTSLPCSGNFMCYVVNSPRREAHRNWSCSPIAREKCEALGQQPYDESRSGSSTSLKPSENCSLRGHPDCGVMRDSGRISQLSHSWIPNSKNMWKIINICCLNLAGFGIICSTMDNYYTKRLKVLRQHISFASLVHSNEIIWHVYSFVSSFSHH